MTSFIDKEFNKSKWLCIDTNKNCISVIDKDSYIVRIIKSIASCIFCCDFYSSIRGDKVIAFIKKDLSETNIRYLKDGYLDKLNSILVTFDTFTSQKYSKDLAEIKKSIEKMKVEFNEKNWLFEGPSVIPPKNDITLNLEDELKNFEKTLKMKGSSDDDNTVDTNKTLKTYIVNDLFGTASHRTNQENRVFLFGKDEDFLKNQLHCIDQYNKLVTKKDSKTPIIEPITSEMGDQWREIFDKGYRYYCQLKLPPIVNELYGKHEINEINGNCHGAALFAAGISPTMRSIRYSPLGALSREQARIVPLKDLTIGDIVFCRENDHSLVYLGETCISMNGAGSKLRLDSTKRVLKTYGMSEDALSSSSESKKITVIRKHQDWHIPDSLTACLERMYHYRKQDSENPKFISVVKTVKKCLIELMRANTESQKYLDRIYHQSFYHLTGTTLQNAEVVLYN